MNQISAAIRVFAVASLTVFSIQDSVLAQEKPEYLQSFDPSKGFKPAQRDLTEIYLQLAGSLEYYGSPIPYLRHIKAEHARIQAAYKMSPGKELKDYCPAYMTDEYIDLLEKNWNALSPNLGLKPLTQDIGHTMRLAIKGTRDTGTIIVEIFNEHQAHVFSLMAGKPDSLASFEALQSELFSRLELNKNYVSEEKYELPRRDAVSFSLGIQGETIKLFQKMDKSLQPAVAAKIKAALIAVFADVGRMADSELQAGIEEWSVTERTASNK